MKKVTVSEIVNAIEEQDNMLLWYRKELIIKQERIQFLENQCKKNNVPWKQAAKKRVPKDWEGKKLEVSIPCTKK